MQAYYNKQQKINSIISCSKYQSKGICYSCVLSDPSSEQLEPTPLS